MDYKLRWSVEAVKNLEEILDNIKSRWTNKEVLKFKNKLGHQLDLIVQNPFMFPISSIKESLRKAVLSKQTTVFYQVKDNIIFITYLHINKKDTNKFR
ncbi:MAG: type II toxin-antitoxin system RelE/ParE family toxin [Bacteroidales bacterium]|nr:type II toxin-antitoxin system RelE/ParE family toxin [Bacteroidales bacterium]